MSKLVLTKQRDFLIGSARQDRDFPAGKCSTGQRLSGRKVLDKTETFRQESARQDRDFPAGKCSTGRAFAYKSSRELN